MKTKMIVVSSALLAFVGAAASAFADTHTWVGGNHAGGGWNTPANWKNASEENECPVAGDTAVFNTSQATVVANDADAALACSLYAVELNGSTVVFDFSTDRTNASSITGSGAFVKRGKGLLQLDSDRSVGVVYSCSGTYSVSGRGIILEEGGLAMPCDKSIAYYMSSLVISNGATFYVPNNKTMQLFAIAGEGDVTVPPTATGDLTLQFGNASYYGTSTFAGRLLSGETRKLKVSSYKSLRLLGTETTVSEWNEMKFVPSEKTDRGTVWATSLGKAGEASSVGAFSTLGLAWSAGFGYLGIGETATKGISIDYRHNNGTVPGPAIFDGGTNGGLRIEGAVNCNNNAGSLNYMAEVILQGSNAVPCVLAGKVEGDMTLASGQLLTVSFVKRGPGVWRFAETGAARTISGTFDVQEGSLQFESIAETNVTCSLGKATWLHEPYVGPYDAAKRVDWAFRLGAGDYAADAVLEFCGTTDNACSTRPIALAGDGRLRANGAMDAALDFSGVFALKDVTASLTVDGTNTAGNVLREVTDGDGTVSLVKDGSGEWTLKGDQTFSGDLTVREGSLVVEANPLFTWFRFTGLGGYNGGIGYLPEVALYDVEGNRRNLDLTFNLPSGSSWSTTYYPGETSHLSLASGEIGFGRYGSWGAWYYLYQNNSPSNLCDGATTDARFSQGFDSSRTNTVVMHIFDGTEIVSIDMIQSDSGQTPSGFVLEGSVDGKNWKKLVETNDLPLVASSRWRFSASGQTIPTSGRSVRKLSDGEGLGFETVAYADEGFHILENVGYVSVSTGATLKTSGKISPTISKLRIDGAAGAGVLRGFTFAKNMTVDVTGIPKLHGRSLHLPVDFTQVTGFDEVEKWTFTDNGKVPTRCSFNLTKTGLDIIPNGLMILIR